jgi:hypothetical protein
MVRIHHYIPQQTVLRVRMGDIFVNENNAAIEDTRENLVPKVFVFV